MLLKVFLMLISNPSLVCVLPAVCQPAWVGARPIVRMTVGARRRENSVAAPPPRLRPRLHRPAAGWPAPGVGGPVAGAVLAPETGTEKGGERSQWEFLCLSELAEMSFSKTDLCFLSPEALGWCWCCISTFLWRKESSLILCHQNKSHSCPA